MAWQPRKWKPDYLRITISFWNGLTPTEIAAETGYSYTHVTQVLASERAQEILEQLTSATLDTVNEVQSVAQAVAPAVMEEKVRLALSAKDERVRNTSCSDILNIAGHQPVKRVQIEKPLSEAERYRDRSEDELRDLVLQEMSKYTGRVQPQNDPDTVH